jgi:hypothetical protein
MIMPRTAKFLRGVLSTQTKGMRKGAADLDRKRAQIVPNWDSNGPMSGGETLAGA